MGRWRPPPPQSTALITRAGFERLRAELDELWRQRRPEVVTALAAAAAEGDRSENAEYHYRKKQLGEIDRRVRYLSKRLEALQVIEQPPADRHAIFFGATFEVADTVSAETSRYRIVGPDETDAATGDISIDSPLARAALKKHVDDQFEVALPDRNARYVVIRIEYLPPGSAG